MSVQTATIETNIPGRLDRLPWARFHWLVVLEIDAIERELEDSDHPLGRDELARRVGARRWGPGRFRDALDFAISDGRVRPLRRSRFESVKAH